MLLVEPTIYDFQFSQVYLQLSSYRQLKIYQVHFPNDFFMFLNLFEENQKVVQ